MPGTDGPVTTKEEAKEFCSKHGLPVIFKVFASKLTVLLY